MIRDAFEPLQKAGLKIKLSKCSFCKEQIHYLGYLVSGNSILPLADKIEALIKLQPQLTSKKLGTTLALQVNYRKVICNYSDIAHPFNFLTKSLNLLFGLQSPKLALTYYACDLQTCP